MPTVHIGHLSIWIAWSSKAYATRTSVVRTTLSTCAPYCPTLVSDMKKNPYRSSKLCPHKNMNYSLEPLDIKT